jgi:hypothetical protein
MSFSTALKISLICLLALAAEMVLSYFLFSNYAFYLAGEGGGSYSSPEAYTGPMGPLAKTFYGLMGITGAVALLAPMVAAGTWLLRRNPKGDAD